MSEAKEKFQIESEKTAESISPLVERGQDADVDKLPKDVESWMTRVEKAQPKTVNDDQTGQPLMTPTAAANPVVVLPVTRKSFTAGFAQAVTEAGRWLSEFIFRVIKIKKGNTEFKEEK